MSEKPAAGLAAAALIAPLVLLCCVGPAGVVSLLSGVAAWLGGLNAIAVFVVTTTSGLLVYALLRARKLHLRRKAKL